MPTVGDYLGTLGLTASIDVAALMIAALLSPMLAAAVAKWVLLRVAKLFGRTVSLYSEMSPLDRVRKGGGDGKDVRLAITAVSNQQFGFRHDLEAMQHDLEQLAEEVRRLELPEPL